MMIGIQEAQGILNKLAVGRIRPRGDMTGDDAGQWFSGSYRMRQSDSLDQAHRITLFSKEIQVNHGCLIRIP